MPLLPSPNAKDLNLLAHAGCQTDATHGSLVMPPYFTSTYQRAEDGSYEHGNVYGRGSNPTRRLFETTMATFENGTDAAAFASGTAGFHAAFSALKSGDHVLLPDDVYHGTRVLLNDVMNHLGITFSTVDTTSTTSILEAIQETTRLLILETPSNPLLKITDLKSVITEVKASNSGITILVDNTWSTPLITKPLDLGADLVLHSVTKYLAGHSDLLGGVIVGKEEDIFWQRIKMIQGVGGGIMDPFTAWLSLRGMRSMAVRFQRQCENAIQLAAWLEKQSMVEKVFFPNLKSHDGYKIALEQMVWPGAMLSFLVRDGNEKNCLKMVAKLKVFTRATSLGGTESLLEHRASVEAQPTKTPNNLIRVSVGLEAAESLIGDLEQAMKE